ncbi:predicted protein [Histoplasma capsulatum G186AR]|uniref:Uncharacterized protein n=1 Tax=Ajellomyces capsulatus (strain G186AR / H82 / ATCC MYA-2454 / RMSCC 2432) TaxID=447093 RepID=C0NU99_AJECG|nr:uncharacterized protein HCBG_06930 [Histoplasma capsulatum G186AR]EEH04979.1 predicted protein [Histoplasma capsulatum G186AR]
MEEQGEEEEQEEQEEQQGGRHKTHSALEVSGSLALWLSGSLGLGPHHTTRPHGSWRWVARFSRWGFASRSPGLIPPHAASPAKKRERERRELKYQSRRRFYPPLGGRPNPTTARGLPFYPTQKWEDKRQEDSRALVQGTKSRNQE